MFLLKLFLREFIEKQLIDFAKQNPGTVVYVKPRRHRTPVIVAEYLNGDREWHNCRNLSEEEIAQWISLMKTQNGSSSSLRLRKMWHTDLPSIQGPWTPFTLKNPANNLVVFPNEELSQPLDVEKSATEKLIEMFREQRLSEGKLEENRAN